MKTTVIYFVLQATGGEVRLHGRLRLQRVRGSGLRRLGRTGLRFFAGVARRLLAPLAVVSTAISRLGVQFPKRSSLCAMVNDGVDELVHLLRRVLRFHGTRANGLGLHISPKSITTFIGGRTRSFLPLIGGHGVRFSMLYGPRSVVNCFSASGLSGVLCGLLSGTTGCGGRNNCVRIALVCTRSESFIQLRMGSGNDNVSGSGRGDLFGQFCRKSCQGFGAVNANVNLSLMGSLIRLRKKDVRIRDRRNQKARFVIALPMSHSCFGRRRVSRRTMLPMRGAIACLRRRGTRGIITRGPGTRAVLIIRSGRRLLRLVIQLLGHRCGIRATRGNRRTIAILSGRSVSLVISSIVVPMVSNVRFYEYIGGGLRLDRVPIVLLATGGGRRSHTRTCRIKTSTFVDGPFGLTILRTHVHGLLGCGRHGTRSFGGRLIFRVGRLSCADVSRSFVRHTVSYMGHRLRSSSFSRPRFIRRVNADGSALCGGLGSLAKLGASTFVHGVHLGTTYHVVRRGKDSIHISSLTCTINFGSPGCFDSYFGGRFNVLPARCRRHFVRS